MPQDCCLTMHYPIPMLYSPESISLTYFHPQHIFLLASSLVVLAPCLVHPPPPIQSLIHTYSQFLSSSPYIYPDSPTKLTLLPWRWKQKVSLKRWHISTRTHGLTFQNLAFFITCYSSRNNSKKLEALSRMHKAYFTPHATLSWLFYFTCALLIL